ncbi:guanylate kinase [candidate division FCPU426 bacterium]|nr:guanylate kinase [candidate division FCPU426 bacterium]
MRKPGLLIVLSSPSGGGKTTISERLLRRDPLLVRSISATTRQPRGRERRGRDYYYLDKTEFIKRIKRRLFLEWALVHDHYYGTLRSEVGKHQSRGRDVLLVIDVQGGLAVKRLEPGAVLIFIMPPNRKELDRRLRSRGTENARTIRQRLQHARWEMRFAEKYDYTVVNRRLAQALAEVQAILTAERLRVRRRQLPAGKR